MREREPIEWPECIVTLEESHFGGLIHFVPDDATVLKSPDGLYMGWPEEEELQRYEPGVVYRASEALLLAKAGLSQEQLRVVHAAKRFLGVRVDQIELRPRRLWTEDEVCAAWSDWSHEEREHYTALRVSAIGLQGASETEASLEQRQVAASWAAERVSREEVSP